MANQATSSAPRITRQQAIILAVLGTALIAALLYNPSDDNSQTGAPTAITQSGRQRTSELAKPAEWKPNWPQLSLDKMLQNNPFAPIHIPDEPTSNDPAGLDTTTTPAETSTVDSESEPKPSDDTAQRKSEEALAAFQTQKVKLTLRSGDKVSALIGNRLVHEGEIIDGVRVVSIQPTGVLVEPVRIGP